MVVKTYVWPQCSNGVPRNAGSKYVTPIHKRGDENAEEVTHGPANETAHANSNLFSCKNEGVYNIAHAGSTHKVHCHCNNDVPREISRISTK